jgi:hypothetical protein
MATNRMILVNPDTGLSIPIAKLTGDEWYHFPSEEHFKEFFEAVYKKTGPTNNFILVREDQNTWTYSGRITDEGFHILTLFNPPEESE